jgi:hypothetical protein
VIDGLEDSEDYRGFEAAIIADNDAETAVERELVLRLASLLWRLRRIIAIETDLFQIQSEILRDRRNEMTTSSLFLIIDQPPTGDLPLIVNTWPIGFATGFTLAMMARASAGHGNPGAVAAARFATNFRHRARRSRHQARCDRDGSQPRQWAVRRRRWRL